MHAGGGAIDPTNMMPAVPKQQPAPGQSSTLPTERVTSSILRGAGDSNWVYPSQQMFFNALQRKGKAEGGDESAPAAVVSIHNNMNESTWRRVLEWESLHAGRVRRAEAAPLHGAARRADAEGARQGGARPRRPAV